MGEKGIDKVAAIGKGLVIVILKSMEQRDVILNEGFQFFDKKPVLVKDWHRDMDLSKEEAKRVPIASIGIEVLGREMPFQVSIRDWNKS